MNYPIGQRGECVVYDIATTCYGLIQMLMKFCEYLGEDTHTGEHLFTYEGTAHDVVQLVHDAQDFTDGVTGITYLINDTEEQDWAAVITISEGQITDVLEEGVPIG